MNKICDKCGDYKPIVSKGLCAKCYKAQKPIKVIKCNTCGKVAQQEAKGMCRKCYAADYHKKNYSSISRRRLPKQKKYVSCIDCQKPFNDELKHYSKGFCHSCFPMKRGRQIITEEDIAILQGQKPDFKSLNCLRCGILLTEVKKSAKSLCNSCYGRIARVVSSKNCLVCNMELDTPRVKPICPHCKTNWRLIERLPTPNELRDMRHLLVKARNGMINELDVFRIIHLYLNCVGNDENIHQYSNTGLLEYCLRAFKLWQDNPKVVRNKDGTLWKTHP